MPNFQILKIRKGSHKSLKWEPVIRVQIKQAEDLFDWYLVRAVCNRQLSMFAICVVCGEWDLKDIRGQRSEANVSHTKRWERTGQVPPKWYFRLPQWPAVCSRLECKYTFQNIVRGRIRFDSDNSLFQWMWKGFSRRIPVPPRADSPEEKKSALRAIG